MRAAATIIDLPLDREEAEYMPPPDPEPAPAHIEAMVNAAMAAVTGRVLVTLEQAVEAWLTDLRGRVGLTSRSGTRRGLKAGTFNGYAFNVRRCISVDAGIDKAKPLAAVTRDDLIGLYDYWHSDRAGVSEATADNYCRDFKKFLDYARDEREEWDFQKPKGTDRVYTFRTHTAEIEEYDPAKLRAIRTAAPERTWLYALLGLNCGFTQVDVANLKQSDVWEHEGQTYLWRKRPKTSRQNAFETLHWLFPETADLVKKHLAPANPDGWLLLNENNKKLLRAEPGKPEIDNISTAYDRAVNVVRETTPGFSFAFKHFRKLGATAVKRIGNVAASRRPDYPSGDDLARMFLGQRIRGALKAYAKDAYQPVTEALQTWYGELQRDGVF